MADIFLTSPSKQKRAAEVKPFTIDLKRYLRSYWIAERRYALNECVRAIGRSGLAYQVQVAGEAGSTEPAWPMTIGNTVIDGSITWVAVAADTNAVDAISSANWSAPTGITVGSQSNTIEEATATISGGTAGTIYTPVSCVINTVSGKVYQIDFSIEVT